MVFLRYIMISVVSPVNSPCFHFLSETSEPYWTTNYHFKQAAHPDIMCPIFKRDLPFERWLGLWCRYLVIQSMGGHYSTLFQACRGETRRPHPLYVLVLVLAYSSTCLCFCG